MKNCLRHRGIGRCLALMLAHVLCGGPVFAQENPAVSWRPLTAVFHVHSQLSSGTDSLDSLAAQAKEAGIDAIIMTDNYLLQYRYGQYPLRGLIRKTVEMPSVLTIGIDRYLSQIDAAAKRHPNLIFMPGVEVVPHYYWTGSVFKKDLTMHDAQKNILVLGLQSDEDYRSLPVAENYAAYRYGWATLLDLSPVLLIPPAWWLITRQYDRKVGTYMTVKSRRVVPGAVLLLAAVLLLVNNYPFASPRYDTYEDGNGLKPYQDLIEYVRARGGVAVWSMPEARDLNKYDYGRLGTVTVRTDPYPQALLQTTGYTGFGALYEDTIRTTEPGGVWDAALGEYLQGRRPTPPWGFGEVAYHGAAHDVNKELELIEMVFWVRDRTTPAILDAMAKGRMYSLRRTKEWGITLDEFSIAQGGGRKVISGETLTAPSNVSVELRVAVSATDGQSHKTSVEVIRSGRSIVQRDEKTPFQLVLEDLADGPGYYRVMIGYADHKIVSNPIFVNVPVSAP